MRIERKKRAARPAVVRIAIKKPRVETADHSHARWPAILKLIGRLGDRDALLLDEDGWLSARQIVLVAFVDDKPAGYLIFHIYPVGDGRVEARVDAMTFNSVDASDILRKALSDAAVRHCKRLKCVRFKGLKIKADRKR